MFELTLVDHLRMSFGHVIHRHKAHERIAHVRSRLSRILRAVEALLMIAVVVLTLAAAFGRGSGYEVAGAVLATCALLCLLLHLAFDLDNSARAHSWCATRLWHIREQYRALLSDLSDGALDLNTVRRRRDELSTELRSVYENAPPADHQAYQSAGRSLRAADDRPLADEEIDQFLPKSLQAAGKSVRA